MIKADLDESTMVKLNDKGYGQEQTFLSQMERNQDSAPNEEW